jgi:putative nucleotidyltransferase with HDIG domain
MDVNRDDAWQLLTEYTKSDSLLKHALAVEAALRGYARKFGESEDDWGVVGLLHDFDYERWPTLGDHPNKGSEILREKGYPEWVIRAILSHAEEITGVTRDSRLEKTLFACDELSGFITAASLVRPSKSVLDLEARSEKKRMKDKAFARGVKREDLIAGAELLGLTLDEHSPTSSCSSASAPTRSGCGAILWRAEMAPRNHGRTFRAGQPYIKRDG